MDEEDELGFNVFYLLLRNEHRKKYDFALTKCWTICVPCGVSLREVSITKEFVDDHVLKAIIPGSNALLTSTDEKESHLYKIEDRAIKLINNDGTSDDDYEVKILSIEKGYNKEYQPYNIIIVDKPINRKYKVTAETSPTDKLQLNRTITSYQEAVDFLKELADAGKCNMKTLDAIVARFHQMNYATLMDMRANLHELLCAFWGSSLQKQSLDVQRDARFQKLLSLSIEMFVTRNSHDRIYKKICQATQATSTALKSKIDSMIGVGITADQLGVKESLAISLPWGIVELANLDSAVGPHAKLLCLRNTLDMIIGELKGAIAAVEAKTDSTAYQDPPALPLTTDDLIHLCLFVVVKCRCYKLYGDIFYIENFMWSIDPKDHLVGYTLTTFKAALQLLEQLDPQNLPARSENVRAELQLCDLMKVASIRVPKTPVEREMLRLGRMVGMSTRVEDSGSEND